MINASDFRAAQRQPPHEQGRVRIESLGIISNGRVGDLKRCVGSWVRHLHSHSRACEVIVMDDAECPETRKSVQAWLRGVARRSGVQMSYAGAEEKSRFARNLLTRGIPPDIVRMVFRREHQMESSPGSNRNALLLHGVGAGTMSCDEDAVCKVYDLRRGSQALTAVPIAPTAERLHFMLADSLSADLPEYPDDLLAAHESLLGRPLSELIHPFENTMKVDAAKMGSRILCDLLDGAGAVAVTVSGVVGDPGLPHLAPILTAQEPTRTRLAPFWHATGIRTNFHAILGVNRPILSIHGPLATTTATGLDNRSPLPPFVPFGTGEDTLFGSMLVKCLRGAYVGYLPFGLLHVHRHRAYSPPPSRPRVADLIGLIAADAPDVLSSGAESRMKAIGQHIVSCGTAPLGEFSEYVVQRSRRFLLNLIERCQALLDQYGGDPPDWAENLADWIARLEQVMLSPDVGIPANLPHAETTVERSVHLQQIVRDFGALLCSWSEVWKAARCLKDSGVALARRVE